MGFARFFFIVLPGDMGSALNWGPFLGIPNKAAPSSHGASEFEQGLRGPRSVVKGLILDCKHKKTMLAFGPFSTIDPYDNGKLDYTEIQFPYKGWSVVAIGV